MNNMVNSIGSKLKIYNGEKHPHEVQKPKVINFVEINKMNIVK